MQDLLDQLESDAFMPSLDERLALKKILGSDPVQFTAIPTTAIPPTRLAMRRPPPVVTPVPHESGKTYTPGPGPEPEPEPAPGGVTAVLHRLKDNVIAIGIATCIFLVASSPFANKLFACVCVKPMAIYCLSGIMFALLFTLTFVF
jgi:hypothetical protein